MDKRPFIGILLILIILFGWQFFMMKTMPQKQEQKSTNPKSEIRNPKQAQEDTEAQRHKEVQEYAPETESVKPDTIENKLTRIVFSQIGGSIVSIQLKKYEGLSNGGERKIVELIPQDRNAFQDEIILNNQQIYLGDKIFKVIEKTDRKIVYEIAIPFQKDDSVFTMKGQKTYELADSSYLFDVSLNFPTIQQHNILITSGLASTEKNKQMELRYFGGVVSLGKTVYVKTLQQLDTIPKGDHGNIDWAGVKNKYFVAAIIPLCETQSYEFKKFAFGNTGGAGCACGFAPVTHNPDAIRIGLSLSTRASDTYKYKIYAGPLDYEILSGTGHNLQEACYLGFKWIRPVSGFFLKVFSGLHKLVPNYGIVIIIFSFLISVLFFPLTRISQKSALSMQRLQPKMQELQKKYKNEPKKLNQAVMELYRKEGVSPVSGCLPMVIQMPVFFALYAVLDTAIALRNAVFIPGWIENLSQPDPFFALPIAMGVMMFIQQKLQGSAGAMNPQMAQQQKMMMYFMPVMFVVIFLRFPAGLVLYWFVYNIFSVTQTYIIKKSLRVEGLKS